MSLHRALTLAAVLAMAGLTPAAAQFPPPPGPPGSQSAFPPPPRPGGQAPAQSSPFPPPPGAPSQQGQGQSVPYSSPLSSARPDPRNSSACEAFVPLRTEAEKGAAAIRAASERKASREEVCPLFQRFATSEAKVLKFLETHITQCGIPPDVVKQSKVNHAKTLTIRTAVCAKAAGPAAPSLSDALGGPVVPEDEGVKKPGRGTFDTLTGPIKR